MYMYVISRSLIRRIFIVNLYNNNKIMATENCMVTVMF